MSQQPGEEEWDEAVSEGEQIVEDDESKMDVSTVWRVSNGGGFYESEQSSVRASLLMRPHSFPLEDPFTSCPPIVKIHALINTWFPQKEGRYRYVSYSWSGTRGYDFLHIDHIAAVIT